MRTEFGPGSLPRVAALLGCLFPVLLALDLATPLTYTALTSLYVSLWSRRPRWLWPIILLGLTAAVAGVFVSNLLYTRDLGGETVVILGRAFPRATFERATLLTIRAWALSAISAASWMLLSPEDLVDDLMQQAHFPVRWGFSLWTALNALPRLAETERTIRTVHRYRSGQRRRAFFPAALSLLAAMIRYAERAAITLAERGLDRAVTPRSWYRPRPWRAVDTAVLIATLTMEVLVLVFLIRSGLFRFGLYL